MAVKCIISIRIYIKQIINAAISLFITLKIIPGLCNIFFIKQISQRFIIGSKSTVARQLGIAVYQRIFYDSTYISAILEICTRRCALCPTVNTRPSVIGHSIQSAINDRPSLSRVKLESMILINTCIITLAIQNFAGIPTNVPVTIRIIVIIVTIIRPACLSGRSAKIVLDPIVKKIYRCSGRICNCLYCITVHKRI